MGTRRWRGADPSAGGRPHRLPAGGPARALERAGIARRPELSRYVRPATFPIVHEFGGGGPERPRIVCCFLGIDERPYNPLLAALPKTIHLGASDASARPGSGWLGGLLTIAAKESSTAAPGGQNVLERLSELLFVEAIRRYVDTLPPNQTGWLAGLRDPVIGEALSALHAEPAEVWTVERLARSVGVSRSVLAERFTEMVGQPPMQYLALWRMQLASRLLAEGGRVAAVSASAGYESEAAFYRAFKKVMGQSPAAWRRRTDRSA